MPIERLPAKMRPVARRVRAFVMTDSTALLILAVVQIAVGAYYVPGILGDPLQWQRPSELVMPLMIWAWVHIIVGVVAAIIRKWHLDTVVLAVSTALNLSWASSLMVASIETGEAVLWLVAVLIFALTVSLMWAVWRGKRGDIPFVKEGGKQ
ncbi:hypothetical protein EU799_11855 [Corynebacterium silvaticum]|uniref:hypothetical protein n=1 Tax=Corynebacterium silvaticum TaxID=2320431 RepID=UPI001068A5B2|nr:hypothetical protein [Corynebacterium silvaticum]MBH5301213.1 hypothetical protein [Corynebacterium silvaticum]NOM65890.1 hypothetical protein [Corynebacterium silvaticum]TFA91328.1 hypothetical protein EU802_11860 [Corynebacterium silvaticum]TFA91990.1 hypothetical protein EU799_11855 [Corynebacterium silvaticum]TNX78338.1 hypothetical protein FIT55_11875 [Corynebacterium silvaticum]